jgi:hypothetical protein
MSTALVIRDLRATEFDALGKLMVEVYSSLEGFPTPLEQPHYYELLANIGRFTEKPDARVLVAESAQGALVGGIVYFADMAEYGSAGSPRLSKAPQGFVCWVSALIIATLARAKRWPTRAFALPRRRGIHRSSCTQRKPCKRRGGSMRSSASCGRKTWTSCNKGFPSLASGSS